ncbi:ABC transporter substrate-binding protein [Prauserella cavernicola]|uniref:ABC transporter substrate-binding protein n=1 Tax=Prauserella cavernicola TaxID=2800127 RepID=A0A934V341_9PSEU|nr:ABC transporter substrate-binding protein [Prauserella cavernicola]MBK1783882.1 ABC transporter substrate-binding protein [Prauserella cavernicola]
MTMHSRMRSLLALTAAGVLAASVAGCGAGSDGSSVAMTLASPTWNAGIASIAVSQELGYFEQEGLDVEVILTDSATTQAQQIATGQVATGAVSPEPVILGRQPGKDLDLSYFMSYYRKNIYGLQVPENSGITSVADLKGKTIGAISLASASVTQAKIGLEEAGVPADSVTFIAIGSGAQQATAVKDGNVDAVALLDTSFQTLENQGIPLRPIDVPGTDDLTSGGLAARSEDLKANPDLYVKLGRAIAKGVVFSAANPEAAIRILYDSHPEAQPRGLDEDKALASGVKVLESRLANLGTDDEPYGELEETAMEASVSYLLKAGLIDQPVEARSLFDNSLIERINDFDVEAVRASARDHQS